MATRSMVWTLGARTMWFWRMILEWMTEPATLLRAAEYCLLSLTLGGLMWLVGRVEANLLINALSPV